MLQLAQILCKAWKNSVHSFSRSTADDLHSNEPIMQATQEVITLATDMDLEVDCDDIIDLLDSHNQELTVDDLIEIEKQNSLNVSLTHFNQKEEKLKKR